MEGRGRARAAPPGAFLLTSAARFSGSCWTVSKAACATPPTSCCPLRRTLQSFTQRADIIIRQLSYLHSQKHSDIVGLCRELSALPAEQAARLPPPARKWRWLIWRWSIRAR